MFVPKSPSELVAETLRAELADVPSGTRLPTVRDLAERFGVSPTTITRSLDMLKRERLLVSRAGVGVYRA